MTAEYRRAIAIMAKAPLPGESKTRLAAAVGAEAAAALHRAFLNESMATACSVAQSLGETRVALMSPDRRHATMLEEIAISGVEVWTQQRPGLMAGICEACERGFAEGANAVLVSETDSPTLPAAHLLASFRLLLNDAPALALGPCADGGYYLAGATGLSASTGRDLFEGETYASDTICQRTAARARVLGLKVELGPEWYDVDTIDDLRRLQGELEQTDDGQFACLRSALAELTRTKEDRV